MALLLTQAGAVSSQCWRLSGSNQIATILRLSRWTVLMLGAAKNPTPKLVSASTANSTLAVGSWLTLRA